MTVGGWMYQALNQELSLDQAMRESMARAFSRLAGRLFSFALVFMIAAVVSPLQAGEDDFEPNFPRTMSWSAYNLGTTGYNQA